MTITCACWRCTGRAWNDGSAHGEWRLSEDKLARLNPDPLRPLDTDTDPHVHEWEWCHPHPDHITPVGGWLLICGLILVVVAAIVWRLSRG